MKVISIDPGKGFIKYAYKASDGSVITKDFESKITEINNFNDIGIVGEDSFKVNFEDKSYIIGKQGKGDALHERTKMSAIHKVAAYTALTQIPFGNEEVVLVVCIPGTSFKSKDLRSEYKEYFTSESVLIEVNDTIHDLAIKNVVVLPEGAGFIFLHSNLCKDKERACCIDIGKYNVGLTTFSHGEIMDMVSLDIGGAELERIALEMLESKFDIGVTNITQVITQGYLDNWGSQVEGSSEVISEAKRIYIEKIIKDSSDKNIDLSIMQALYFIGGTSKVIEQDIYNHNKLSKTSTVVDNAKYINAIGNLIYGEKLYG